MFSLKFGEIKQSALCITFTFIWICVVVISGQNFDYTGQHGPQHWAENYKRCSGKYQSPININDFTVKLKKFGPTVYNNFDTTPKKVTLTNNGHTVQVTMEFEEGTVPNLQGGPLERKTKYQFEQFHFHWGTNDTIGSEDFINNHAFPAELHVVMRSVDFKDFTSALGQDHGIVVLAFFISVSKEDNPFYKDFTESLPLIFEKNLAVDLLEPLPLMKFLAIDLVNYYSYVGSLTTPPCSEKVLWIDYMGQIFISEKQLNFFRKLTLQDIHLRNNYRPTQPINERVIYGTQIEDLSVYKNPFSAIPFVNVENLASNYKHQLWVFVFLPALIIFVTN